MTISTDTINKVNKIRDYLYGGGYPDPLSNAEQLSYLFYFNLFEFTDENNVLRGEKSIFDGNWNIKNPSNYNGESFISKELFKWSVWSISYTGEELVNFVKDEVFSFYSDIAKNYKNNFMLDSKFLIDNPVVFTQVVELIRQLKLENLDFDTKGDIFEYILKQTRQAGELGQFRTPRHIIDFMVKILNPKFGETIYDPAVGTAGFLVSAYNHITLKNTSNNHIHEIEIENRKVKRGVGDLLKKNEWEKLYNSTFYGNDVDPKMVRLAQMNLSLRGLQDVYIKRLNTLTTTIDANFKRNNSLPLNGYDVVLANPPFSGTIDKDRINEDVKVHNSTSTEILFIQYIFNSTKPDGRLGIIVPEGVLSNAYKANKILRKYMIEKCNLEAIISLPAGVFKPYSGVKTSIIILKKNSKTKNVFFYSVNNDGYKLDANHSKKILENDLPGFFDALKNKIDLKAKWDARNVKDEWKENWWFAEIDKISKKDFILSASLYRPFTYKIVDQGSPIEILENIKNTQNEISNKITNIQKILNQNYSKEQKEIKLLKDISTIIMGQSPLGEFVNEIGDGTPLIGGPSELGEIKPKKIKFTTKSTKLCQKNDILISVRGTIGIINIADDEYCLGRGVAAIRPNLNKVTQGYLKQSLLLYSIYLKFMGLGAVIKGIKKDDLQKIKILTPNSISHQEELSNLFSEIEFINTNYIKLNNVNMPFLNQSIFPKYWNDQIDDLFSDDD